MLQAAWIFGECWKKAPNSWQWQEEREWDRKVFVDPLLKTTLCSYLTCHPFKYFSLTNKHALKANLFCCASLGGLADKESIVGKKRLSCVLTGDRQQLGRPLYHLRSCLWPTYNRSQTHGWLDRPATNPHFYSALEKRDLQCLLP